VGAAFSPNGRQIATVCDDNDRHTLEKATASVWDTATGRKLFDLESDLGGHSGIAFSPDGRRIVGGSITWVATVWDASNGRRLLRLRGHKGQVIKVGFTPDNKRIITAGFDNTTRIWDAEDGEELLTLKDTLLTPVSPDGLQWLAGTESPITILRIPTPEQVRRWQLEEQRQ
jgi:WD40 repeat protein